MLREERVGIVPIEEDDEWDVCLNKTEPLPPIPSDESESETVVNARSLSSRKREEEGNSSPEQGIRRTKSRKSVGSSR